jgi:hypothetical protein
MPWSPRHAHACAPLGEAAARDPGRGAREMLSPTLFRDLSPSFSLSFSASLLRRFSSRRCGPRARRPVYRAGHGARIDFFLPSNSSCLQCVVALN